LHRARAFAGASVTAIRSTLLWVAIGRVSAIADAVDRSAVLAEHRADIVARDGPRWSALSGIRSPAG